MEPEQPRLVCHTDRTTGMEKPTRLQPLEDPTKQFRLIRFAADSSLATTRCDIVVKSLADSVGSYSAISYTWGGLERSSSIIIKEHGQQAREVFVGRNLGLALRDLHTEEPFERSHTEAFESLREAKDSKTASEQTHPRTKAESSYQSRYFWVDGLCIEQTDQHERNHQVSLMGLIYRNATRVMVWLDFEHRIERLEEWIDHLRWQWKLPATPEVKKRHDDILTADPWWTRFWTVQEAIMGREVIFYSHDKRIPWTVFESLLTDDIKSSASRATSQNQTLRLSSEDSLAGPVQDGGRTPFLKLRNIRKLYSRQVTARTQAMSSGLMLDRLLWEFRNRLVTVPQDRIFALLGVAQVPFIIIPDYNVSVEEVFSQFSKDLVSREDISPTYPLEHIALTHDIVPRSDNISSWAARWDSSSPKTFEFMGAYDPHVTAFDSDGSICLWLQGVASLIKADSRKHLPGELEVRGKGLRVVSSITENIWSKLEPGPLVRKPALALREWMLFAGISTSTLPKEAFAKFIRTVLSDRTSDRRTRLPTDVDFYGKWMKLLIPGPSPPGIPFLDRSELRIYSRGFMDKSSCTQCKHDADAQYTCGRCRQFTHDLLPLVGHTVRGWHLAKTERDDLVLVPKLTKVSDIVAILLGMSTPVILRYMGKGRYKVVGRCYLDGYMDGKAVKDIMEELLVDGEDRSATMEQIDVEEVLKRHRFKRLLLV
ncbi:hypothetical protein K491DRAFT_690554 [Lophiostoma macrostomum CBS 122681]|uniref:Heterokaryon incompatibility domain-containing protein n=1 Tax=Lophiostoma macrostomum CBS 122681 TaxID=1314788 RepID=A0A6A6TDT4_9PLEO|nr:hypothetical protein K491DRAFT_690554 [Lophiostoma macrostomum CBS 122681]